MAWRISADNLNAFARTFSEGDKRAYGWTGDVRTMSATNFTNMFRMYCPYDCDGDDYLFKGAGSLLKSVGAREE